MNWDWVKYILQKFFFQIMLMTAFIAFIGVFMYALSVEDNNPPPADGRLQSQFDLRSANDAHPSRDVSVPHMSSREIAELLNLIIVESFSFNAADYQRVTANAAVHFTPEGYEQYKTSLTQSGLIDRVKAGRVQCGAFAEGAPLELNSLVQDGVYKWRFQVPVMISLISPPDPMNPSANTQQNQRVILDVQFRRVKSADKPGDIRIEFWQVKPVRR